MNEVSHSKSKWHQAMLIQGDSSHWFNSNFYPICINGMVPHCIKVVPKYHTSGGSLFWLQVKCLDALEKETVNMTAQRKGALHPPPMVIQPSVEMGFTSGPLSCCSLCLGCPTSESSHGRLHSISQVSSLEKLFLVTLSGPNFSPIPIPSIILYPHGLVFLIHGNY